MRRFRTGLLCSLCILVVVLSGIYAKSAKSDAPENQASDLLERIAALENRVAELEKAIRDQSLYRYQRPMAFTPDPIIDHGRAPIAPQAPSGITPGLTPHYFNGGAYYIVPLTKKASE